MVNNFKKPPVPDAFYMPTCTKAELKAIVPLFPNAKKWREHFKILGGISQNILETTK
jgi:hypothetical protein